MANLEEFKKNWVRPFLFYGNNRHQPYRRSANQRLRPGVDRVLDRRRTGARRLENPYLGIIVDLCLPGLFILGLLLIPVGMWLRQRKLKSAGQVPAVYPEINLRDPVFRHGVEFVLIATFINFVIVGTATYRGVAYMDTPSFCGQSCHVMSPEWTNYHVSSHADVACTACHIAPGLTGFVHAKVNGTKQLAMVLFNKVPTPIMAGDKIPPANLTCLNCHNPERQIGDRMLVETHYADDATNSMTRTIAVLHIGGRDWIRQPERHSWSAPRAHRIHCN